MLTIIIPAFNEKYTIEKLVKDVFKLKIEKQVILVDDGSTDGTSWIIEKKLKKLVNLVISKKKNTGKGSAIKRGIKYSKGDYVIIQDADLEYNPDDIIRMYDYAKKNNLPILYGSRVLGQNRYQGNKKFTSLYRVFFNHMLTIFSNIINNQKLTDAHTCYKLFSIEVVNKVTLIEDDFAFCPEITTKISNLGIEIKEIGIDYNGRSYNQGKKISARDGFRALTTILKYKLLKRKNKFF